MALFKGSYYENVPVFGEDGAAEIASPSADSTSTPAFRGTRARPIEVPEPVLEHTVAVGDRLDTLGQHYYANARDWRRLGDCNAAAIFPEDMIYEADAPPRDEPLNEAVGTVILVPRRREGR